MGEHLFEFDSETELVEAFECFDENDTGMVKVSEFRKWLSESGDRMDDKEASCSNAQMSFLNWSNFVADRSTTERPFHGSTRELQLPGVGQGANHQRGRGRAREIGSNRFILLFNVLLHHDDIMTLTNSSLYRVSCNNTALNL